MRATEVFTPGKFPSVTLIDEHLTEKQHTLNDALETGAVVVSLSGPSKSGKTVFIENAVGKDNLLQVTGAGITTAKSLWDRVFDLLGVSPEVKNTNETSSQGTFGGKINAGASFLVEAHGEINTSGTWGSKSGSTETLNQDYLQLLIRNLRGSEQTVFIDDFHYIPKDVQAEVATQIKEAIRNDVRIITNGAIENPLMKRAFVERKKTSKQC